MTFPTPRPIPKTRKPARVYEVTLEVLCSREELARRAARIIGLWQKEGNA